MATSKRLNKQKSNCPCCKKSFLASFYIQTECRKCHAPLMVRKNLGVLEELEDLWERFLNEYDPKGYSYEFEDFLKWLREQKIY